MKHLVTMLVSLVVIVIVTACSLQVPQAGVLNTADAPVQPASPTQVVGQPPVQATPSSTAIPAWDVDQSAPNVVWYYGCEVVAGIQPTYNNGQCVWRTGNPNEARHVWVPAAYIANAGTNGELEYGPCTYAGVHGGISFTLPTNVVLTDDASLWNWEPPVCDLDTTKEWDMDGKLIDGRQAQSTVTPPSTQSVTLDCPVIPNFEMKQRVEGDGCQYVSTVTGGAEFPVPNGWWGYTTHKNYPPGNAGKQGGVTLYPGSMPS